LVTPTAGSVVLVPFPFSDLSGSKLRPSLVLADAGREDWILCQITSNPYGDPSAILITDDDFDKGSLQRQSYVRPTKLFTADNHLFVSQVGILKSNTLKEIISVIVKMLNKGL
jgi:mRNA interferase MazF